MTIQKLENRIKALEELVEAQAKEIGTLKDIQAIERLQRTYGYYLQHWMYEEIIELFADRPDTVLKLMAGVYFGKVGVRKYFSAFKDFYENPEFLHQIMQLSGIVDIGPDGQTAQGRWYGFGAMAMPVGKGIRPSIIDGIYNTEYVKENGIWKILKLTWYPLVTASPTESWVKKEKIEAAGNATIAERNPKPDQPRDINPLYPSGYIVPFHFKHPVTGEKSSEDRHNSFLKLK